VFPVAQLVADGEISAQTLLPSVLFAPLPEEPVADPWGDAPWIVGAHARARGRRAPGRCITSAKSWLAHPGVDRLAGTLPWGSDEPTLDRLSPVEASRRILDHVRSAYDAASPEHPLSEQDLVLTVPASFDEVARELTVRAANEAGLRVRLLEEPLAAFYDYLAQQGTARVESLAARAGHEAFVLVCDVGGGTTDLTLIRVRIGADGVRLDRVAVGHHLLLGGDNMDLALAHLVEQDLVAPPDRLEPLLFSELVLACRSAKEALLSAGAKDSVPVRVLSRGSRLVGSTLSATLDRRTVESTVLEGFFPVVSAAEAPRRARTGLVGFGLPYEADPAITRHAVAFLRRHLPAGATVNAVLYNGGVFHSGLVRQRLLEAIAHATGAHAEELPAPDPDVAVARGAVAFGLALAGKGPRVGGGSARGYYVGLRAEGEPRAICVVPRGAAEGERHVVMAQGLSIVVGEPVRFDLFSSDQGQHAPGAIVRVDEGLDALPSMTVTFETTEGSANTRLPVHLEGELTAVGTLDVACVESSERPPASSGPRPRRFRLAFDLRVKPERASTRPPSARLSDTKLEAGRELVLRVFGKGRADVEPREARHLVRELERVLGQRTTWTTDVSRGLYDTLVPESRARRRSAEHERAFWMLAGFSGRPGFGYPGDEKRIGKIVPLLQELLIFPDETRGWQQLWIAWRRLAGGLLEPAQASVRDLVDPFLSTDEVKPKKKKGFKPQAEDEMLELAASLENVPSARRADLGRWILERTWTNRDPRLWRALGRVGARIPTYASAHHVVAPTTVERWLDHLLREKWAEVPTAAHAAVQMARVTGDRARDLSEGVRREIARRVESTGAPPEWARAVLEHVPVVEADRAEFFGESLPVGLELRTPE